MIHKEAEEKLLAGKEWPKEGYRLFEISTLEGSSRGRWLLPKSVPNKEVECIGHVPREALKAMLLSAQNAVEVR